MDGSLVLTVEFPDRTRSGPLDVGIPVENS